MLSHIPLRSAVLGFFLSLPGLAGAEPFKTFFPDEYAQMTPAEQAVFDRLDLQQGKIPLVGGIAEVDVPDGYYFLDSAGARLVLEDLWGNPPDDTIAGMIFPRDGWAWAGSWGATVTYDPMGYVSDENAGSYDYDEMLSQMQAESVEVNTWRADNGYDAITILGWAEPPHYEAATNELYWAKRLQFAGAASETLNYDIRELGRNGVLVVGFIAEMSGLDAVKAAAPDILKMVSFTEGNRYADFNPDTDKLADYDLGGLISGNSAVSAGLLIVLLAFLKKGGFVLLLAPLAWLFGKTRNKGNS